MDNSLKFEYMEKCVITQEWTWLDRRYLALRGPSHEIVMIGKSVRAFNWVTNERSKEQSSRSISYFSVYRKRFVGSAFLCRTALPTQVGWSSRLRRSGEECSRNSATKAGRNLWEMPCPDSIRAAAKDCLATVYLKHRSLQSRKATYRGWHLPSAGKSMMSTDDS